MIYTVKLMGSIPPPKKLETPLPSLLFIKIEFITANPPYLVEKPSLILSLKIEFTTITVPFSTQNPPPLL